MAGSILVTISAILQYLAKAQQAQEKLSQSLDQMNKATENLCSVWVGDASDAFRAEQTGMCNWVTQLIGVGVSYITNVKTAAERYQEAEERLSNL